MEGTNGFTSVNNGHPPPATISPTAGAKRKRESKGALKFYAVRVGKTPGIYYSWADCLEQVRGFPKSVFKSFTSQTEAQAFVDSEDGGKGGAAGGTGKFYAVQQGRVPGVYTSWPEVLEQITGWKGPKHKVFKTRTEAELFVNEGKQANGDGGAVESIEMADHASPPKKLKTGNRGKKGAARDSNASPGSILEGGEYEPGEGPLPEGAEDDFDSGIVLDQAIGDIRYKKAPEFAETKWEVSSPVKDAPIRIYTDGSTLSNGRATAIGGVGVYFGPKDKRNVSEPLPGSKQTNQRAELTAILRALEVAPRDRKAIIFTDSQYAINCLTKWFQKWRTNNWHNASNKPVENRDLIQKVIDMLEERFKLNKHRAEPGEEYPGDYGVSEDGQTKTWWDHGPAGIQFVWVKGHAKDEGNNAADELAVNGAHLAKELGEEVQLD